MSLKSHWSRVKNVRKHANNDTVKGKNLRKELYRVTKQAKYKEKNFHKRKKKYTVGEIRHVVTRVEKIRKLELKKRYLELGKPTGSFEKFQKANRHLVDYEIEDIEIYYDSP